MPRPAFAQRFLRGLLYILAVLGLTGLVGWQYLRGSLPQTSGRIALPGLHLPVEVVRDRHGIPHIYAETLRDANFALGFAHAQDRLWQMEMNRRTAAGRLSELFGPSTLDTDKFLRTLGIHRHARATFEHLDPDTQEIFQAYADGVNAFLATNTRPLPPEFLLLWHTPEPWSAADSLGWIKMMAWDLSRSWRDELLRLRLAQKLTPQQIAEFLPPYPGDAPVRLPDLGSLYRGMRGMATNLAEAAPEQLPEGAGSNNWVVDGLHSVTGKPLLANDPHLALTAPAVWYFAHINVADRNVIGATLPGVPMIVLGRNDRIAWGFTNTGPDVQDLHVEKLDASDPTAYAVPDGTRKFRFIDETIRIKGQADLGLRVRVSRHGPIISDVLADVAQGLPAGHVLAFAWTTLRDDDLAGQALVRLGQSGNWGEFVAATRDFHSPQQNIVYADVDGNIGYTAPGRVPLRRRDNDLKGLAPAPGWEAKYDWQGFIPFEELPRKFNPPEGRIATANEKITPPGYRHWISSHWEPPFRARRIGALLQAEPKHSLDSFRRMHADTQSLYVKEVLPLLLAAPTAGEAPARATNLLRAWDGTMALDRPEPLIATAWLRELTRSVYADELGELFPANWAERPLFMLGVLRDEQGQSRWCDDIRTSETETCAQQISRSLELALADLAKRYGADLARWRWQEAHLAVSEHRPFSKQALLARVFQLTVPAPGDSWTLNVGRISLAREDEPFSTRHAASLRALYDLADPDRSLFIHSSGQSGNPLSPLYGNFTEAWAHVDYLPMTTRREAIDEGRIGVLLLTPK